MTKKLIFFSAATVLLSVCPGAQETESRLPDLKLFKGFKIILKTEKPKYGSILARRNSDNAIFTVDYEVGDSAETEKTLLRNGPPGDAGIRKQGAYTLPKLGDQSWISSWPNGKPTGAAKLTVLLGKVIYTGNLMEPCRDEDGQTIQPPIPQSDLALLENMVISAMHIHPKR